MKTKLGGDEKRTSGQPGRRHQPCQQMNASFDAAQCAQSSYESPSLARGRNCARPSAVKLTVTRKQPVS